MISAGSRLGPFELVKVLGTDGMGELWRATDARLRRDVAIRILPPFLAENPQLRARFEREAKAISALSHPHICRVYEAGHEGGVSYLVMELVEGESLAELLRRGPLPSDQVLRIGAQIALALDAAHRNGIVHRDLRPAGIRITESGAKLDFGLSRMATEAAASSQPAAARPPVPEESVLSTLQYMAPEKVDGRPVDARTDIWALGAVLYEMATGRRAFEGRTKASLIASIVSSQAAPIASMTPMNPVALEHVIRRCLEKDPEERWQSAYDVAGELRWIGEAGAEAGIPTEEMHVGRKWPAIVWLAVVGWLVAAAAVLWAWLA